MTENVCLVRAAGEAEWTLTRTPPNGDLYFGRAESAQLRSGAVVVKWRVGKRAAASHYDIAWEVYLRPLQTAAPAALRSGGRLQPPADAPPVNSAGSL